MNNSSQNLPEAIPLVDRISKLPDDLLCHILSFLDTEQAVATSILSKRWEFLWTYVDILEFSNSGNNGITSEDRDQYKQFIRKVLELNRAPLIKRMKIIFLAFFPYFDEDRDYLTLIQTVIFSKNVQSLHLRFYNGDHHKWPLCFFSRNTLVELRLEHADITNIMESPTPPLFPNLKKLHLYEARVSTDSINRFIVGCSILEDFCLRCDYGGDLFPGGCCISSATLKKFDLYNCVRIELNTPALEVLGIRENPNMELLVESSMPSLHEVHISMRLSKSSDLGFLEIFSNVSVLGLEVMKDSDDFKFDPPVHFHNLTKLEIVAPWGYLGLLRFFMENSNNLQVITLRMGRQYVNGLIWEEPQQVPMCLLTSVRTICITDYANEEEVDLVIKYVLANAKVLEHMEIHTLEYYVYDYEIKFHMLQKISKFSRASEMCELSFF